jgi:DNA repair protein RecN (Recombination protein N)
MLDELLVENLGLIARAHLEPGPGLVAVTGETGTGKTLLLGALRLLRGDAARTDRVGPAGDEARVEGRFVVGDAEIAVARRVADGRSKAYLDGSMVPLHVLEDRLKRVVEIIGQHEHISLSREGAVRAILDAGLDAQGLAARRAYQAAWDALTGLRSDQVALGGDRRALERELDLARHQSREILSAALTPEEDQELSRTITRLHHAEEIAETLSSAHGSLTADGGIADVLGDVVAGLRRAVAFDGSLLPISEQADRLTVDASELAGDLRRLSEDLEHDPAALDAALTRHAVLSDLKRKYGETLADVITFGLEAAAGADRLEGLLERADSLATALASAQLEVESLAGDLCAARMRSGERLTRLAEGHLRELGFRRPVLQAQVQASEPTRSGGDRVELLFSSDEDLPVGPVGRVASGGELSRLVLAVRLAAGVADAAVVAFDEIDAGIGGVTALAMGEKLAELATGRQVLVVTHLPQVAAFADTHFVVDREGSLATVRRVEGPDRLAELARMLGGLPASERGRQHAAELMEAAGERRAARPR